MWRGLWSWFPRRARDRVSAKNQSLAAGRDLIVILGGITASSQFRGKIEAFLDEYLVSETGPVPFGGRSEQLARLDDWLSNEQAPNRLLVTAPAGRGKSALLVHWIGSLYERGLTNTGEGGWHVVFVPVSIRFGTNAPSVFYQALATRLADIVPGAPLPAPTIDADAYYADQAGALLRRLANETRVLIVFDGVDEALGGRFDTVFFPRDSGSGLKMVVSARLQAGDVDAKGWLQRLGWDQGVRASSLEIPALNTEQVADVLVRMGAPLDVLGARRPIVERLTELTEGEPLLMRFYAEDLWQRREEVVHIRLEDLDMLKPGFGAYFERWLELQRQAWAVEGVAVDDRTINAVLAVLACALGPLQRDDLTRLAQNAHNVAPALSTPQVLWPLRRFVIGDGRRESGYVLSHPKIGQYLREEYFDAATVRQTLEGFVQWGQTTVEGLNEGRLSPEQMPAYVLQFYQQHLKEVGSGYEPFLELVTDRWRQAWYTYEGGYSGFASDVRAAFVSLSQVTPGDEETIRFILVEQIRSALVLSSLCGLGSMILPDLLRAAVQENVISIERALRLAEMRSGDNRVDALVPLAPFLSQSALYALIQEAKSITKPETKSSHLITLAAHMNEEQRKALLLEALETARSISEPGSRAQNLVKLIPHLTNRTHEEVVSESATAAAAVQDGWARALSLADLAWHLPGDRSDLLRFQAILAANSVTDNRRRALGLLQLAERLPEDQRSAVFGMALSAALSAFREIGAAGGAPSSMAFFLADDAREAFAIALASLARYLPPTQEEPAIRESLRVVRTIATPYSRVETMMKLVPLLPDNFRAEVVSTSYKVALNLPSANNRNHALTKLVPLLPAHLRSEAISEALEAARAEAIEEEPDRVHFLSGIVALVEDESRRKLSMYIYRLVVEQNATGMADDLVQVASFLPQDQRNALCQRAFEAAKVIFHESARLFQLARLAPVLPKAFNELALRALAEAAESASKDPSGFGLHGVAQAMPLLPEEKRIAIVQQALVSASNLKDPYVRAHDLSELLPHVPVEQRAGVVDSALKSARAVASEEARVRALANVAGKLPLAEGAPVVEEAAKLAWSIPDDPKRAQLLVELAPRLPDDQKEHALDQALLIADGLPKGLQQVHLLCRLAELLPHRKGDLIPQAIATARGIADVEGRASAFGALMNHLSGPEKVGALPSILDKCSRQPRGNTLDSLRNMAPTLAEVGGDQLLLATIDAVRETAAWWHPSSGNLRSSDAHAGASNMHPAFLMQAREQTSESPLDG